MAVNFLTREQWGAGELGSGHVVPHQQFNGLVAHHTVAIMPDYDRDGFLIGDVDDIKRYMGFLQHARPDLGDEVPYSFVVFEGEGPNDCWVAEGRGFGVTGAHTAGLNSTRYGIAVAGNTTTRLVTLGMLEGYNWVGRQLHNLPAQPTIGHRDVKATECPGNTLYNRLHMIQPPFSTLLPPLTTPPPTNEEDEDKMILVKKSNGSVRLVTGGRSVFMDNRADVDKYIAAGIKEISVSDKHYDRIAALDVSKG